MVKIIEARAVLTATDSTGAAFKSALDKVNALTKAQSAFSKAGVKEVSAYSKAVENLNNKAGAIEGFRSQQAAMIAARAQFRQAEADVRRLSEAMRQTASPTRAMTREYEAAQRSVKAASAAFQDKVAAVKAARAEMAGYGVTLKNMGQHQAAVQRFRNGVLPGSGPLAQVTPRTPAESPPGGGPMLIGGGLKTAGALAIGYGAMKLHGKVAESHHDYQQAYLYQQAVLGLSKDQQQPMLDQATKIGQDTKFTNADIVKAQTDIGAKLPKELQTPGAIMAITDQTKNYALAMKVSMEEASVAMVGWMKARGYDLSSPEAAEKSARRAANQMVEFAKTTGAKHHDLVGDLKFGAAPGRAGGFSEEFANALSAQLIRIGYEGAMSGTFVRAAAMKLSAPTRKGMAAIATAGLNFNDYVKPGTDISPGGLDKMFQQRFGRGLTADQREKLQAVFDDPEKMGDRGNFVESASGILNDTFARKAKGGKINAQDAERIAKTLNEFHTLSAAGVDSERLMTDLVKRGMTPALASYLFGSEHGGRAVSLNAGQLERDVKNFKNVPENRAASVADKMQEGPQGAYMRMQGSIETFNVALGEATGGLRELSYEGVGKFFDALTWAVKGGGQIGKGIDPSKNPDGSQFFSPNPLNDPAIMEQARRRTDFVRRDPEAARGEAFAKLPPIDVTGKVGLDPSSKVDVNVTVKVQGEAKVTGQSVTAAGNAKGSVGTSTGGGYE